MAPMHLWALSRNEIEFEQGGEWEHLADWMRNDLKNARAVTVENGIIWAFSRKRLIFPGEDNFGFAWWVHENAQAINDLLGTWSTLRRVVG